MKKKIHTIADRDIYIDTHPRDLDLIACAIANQIDIEKCTIGDCISIPIIRYNESIIVQVKIERIIKEETEFLHV